MSLVSSMRMLYSTSKSGGTPGGFLTKKRTDGVFKRDGVDVVVLSEIWSHLGHWVDLDVASSK